MFINAQLHTHIETCIFMRSFYVTRTFASLFVIVNHTLHVWVCCEVWVSDKWRENQFSFSEEIYIINISVENCHFQGIFRFFSLYCRSYYINYAQEKSTNEQ